MRTYLEVSYREGDNTCYPVMRYDDTLDIDERIITRIGTVSVRDGVAMGDIIDALVQDYGI